jgi:hypothetical protein
MRLKIYKTLKGITNSTLKHPKRNYMNVETSSDKVYGGKLKAITEGDPVRRATEKLKAMRIKTSKPMKKAYISFEN